MAWFWLDRPGVNKGGRSDGLYCPSPQRRISAEVQDISIFLAVHADLAGGAFGKIMPRRRMSGSSPEV